MALSMDPKLSAEEAGYAHGREEPKGIGPMPPEEPLDMPPQDLKRPAPIMARSKPKMETRLARLIAFGGALALTVIGAYETMQAITTDQITLLQGLLVIFFTINFAWIAVATCSAVAGVFATPARPLGLGPAREGRSTRTALIMPVYNEDALATTAALRAMGEALVRAGAGERIDIMILSDSTDPHAWVRETMAFSRLREALGNGIAVWYRRRWRNVARKAGNIEDFVERWGGRYDFMIVLDADSLMSADTILTLMREMEADDDLGILQTVPAVIGGKSLFARLQQYAGATYGPVVSRAIAAWQGDDGNYWGHNAIIRTSAFAAACGLPVLPGKKPFGGEIMSHDFVEAALMRRAGFKVRMLPDQGGSYEESPPSLLDTAIRDRRWAQGNLQHAKVIGARGLAWPNRVHFAIGIMSYLSSLFWLGLIVVGISLTLQAQWVRPEYFPDAVQLFPNWPRFDPERMLQLFILTMTVLFLPKLIGLVRQIFNRAQRRAAGGVLGSIVSVIVEILLSALYAPIMMLLQCRQLYEIFNGRDSGWATQRRDGETSWGEAWRVHRWHSIFGLLLGAAAWMISPILLAWLSPILAGLVLSIPLSRLSGNRAAGSALARLRLLRIPEDIDPPDVVLRRNELLAEAEPLPEDGLLTLVQSKIAREQHEAALAPRPIERRGEPNADHLTAAAKIADAESRDEALSWLSRAERLQIQGDPVLLAALAGLPHLVSQR